MTAPVPDEATVTPPDGRAASPGGGPRSAVLMAMLVVVAALAFTAGIFVSLAANSDNPETTTPTDGSVDAGFARDMRDHHAQAVQMSVAVRDDAVSQQVDNLALDIELTQQQQLGQMAGWLSAWGLDQAGSSRMAWMDGAASQDSNGSTASSTSGTEGMEGMDHESSNSPSQAQMPGMATPEQLQQLEAARGARAERIYLQLMIPHHQAGVAMAEYALQNATQPQVRRLAQTIVDSQTAELTVLRSMLAARGGPVGMK